MKTKRTPIGIIPKEYWERQIKTDRFIQLSDAINRYNEAKVRVPDEWIDEYLELSKYLKKSGCVVSPDFEEPKPPSKNLN